MTVEEKAEWKQDRQKFMKEVLQNENECFEYKLVGINIHSGTAEAGHYWSLINTERFIIDENSEEWPHTEN